MSHYSEIKEKRQILRDIYGGMMEAVKVGRGIRYETDQVAKAIVNGRGMV